MSAIQFSVVAPFAMVPPTGNARTETQRPKDRSGVAGPSRAASAHHSEPSDLAVRRGARRLDLLDSRSAASRLPGSARPMVDGTRPVDADDVSLVSLIGCAVLGVVTFLVLFAW